MRLHVHICIRIHCLSKPILLFLFILSHPAQKDFSLIIADPSACTLAPVVVTSIDYFNDEFKTQVISTSIILVLEIGDILLSLYDFHKLRLMVNAANSNQGFTWWESSASA